jgi:hypothetical protein
VIGCGGSGTKAGIYAHDAGAKVIIIEKAPEGNGNSHVGWDVTSSNNQETDNRRGSACVGGCGIFIFSCAPQLPLLSENKVYMKCFFYPKSQLF